MSTFESNIISIYHERGKLWLQRLPQLVEKISSRLQLRDLREVSNLSNNYVLSGFQGNKPIILKLSPNSEALEREAVALKCFAGHSAVKTLASGEGMLLLERAVPGTPLKSLFPEKEREAHEIACKLMQKLWHVNMPENHSFPHIKDWLSVLDKHWQIPSDTLQKARKLRDQVLQTCGPDILLHGDLHHDNILQNGDSWVVIDPKGVIGDPTYEVAAFIRNPMPELLRSHNAVKMIQNRITRFANLFKLPPNRILDWCFVQAVLAWSWALEDGCDPTYMEQFTRIFDNM